MEWHREREIIIKEHNDTERQKKEIE